MGGDGRVIDGEIEMGDAGRWREMEKIEMGERRTRDDRGGTETKGGSRLRRNKGTNDNGNIQIKC